MGTYDNRGGSALSPNYDEPTIYAVEDDVLAILEANNMPEDEANKVIDIVHNLAETNSNMKYLLLESVAMLTTFQKYLNDNLPNGANMPLLVEIQDEFKRQEQFNNVKV